MINKKSDTEISILLPTYNERDNIVSLIQELLSILKNEKIEIIVIDDDSPDKTWNIVENSFAKDKQVRLIRRINKRGLTSALNDGIDEAKGNIIVWMDCDFQMPPKKVLDLVNAVRNGYDVAIGSRFISGGNDLRVSNNSKRYFMLNTHKILSRIICAITSILFMSKHTDWTSGFIAIRKNIFKEVRLYGNYGEYFMYLVRYLQVKKFRITEIPYVLTYRHGGESKTAGGYSDFLIKGIRYIAAVVRLTTSKQNIMRYMYKHEINAN